MRKVNLRMQIHTVTAINVHVKFSDEIEHWDEKSYYLNPKFMEFWDRYNTTEMRRKIFKKGETQVWRVAYSNLSTEKLAREGKLPSNILRFIHSWTTNICIDISPEMNIMLMHNPSRLPTTHEYGLQQLVRIFTAFAKYCGGTVEITIPKKQRRFVWGDIDTTTYRFGKGIRKLKVVEPKRKVNQEPCEYDF